MIQREVRGIAAPRQAVARGARRRDAVHVMALVRGDKGKVRCRARLQVRGKRLDRLEVLNPSRAGQDIAEERERVVLSDIQPRTGGGCLIDRRTYCRQSL